MSKNLKKNKLLYFFVFLIIVSLIGFAIYIINKESSSATNLLNQKSKGDLTYTVIHRYQKLDGTYVEKEETLTGSADTPVKVPTKDKKGFTSPESQKITLKELDTNSIVYTYSRNNYHLTLTNEEDIDSSFTSGNYPYKTEITLKAKNKPGYKFSKWSNNVTTKKLKFKIDKDIVLYPIYTPNKNTNYTVIHKKMNIDGVTYTEEERETFKGETNTEVTPEVKTYEGFISPSSQTVNINSDGSTVVEYLYERNICRLTIEDSDKVEVNKSGIYYCGVEITLVAKDIPGYDFIGWENGDENKTYTFNINSDKTVKPLYKENLNKIDDTYIVTFVYNDSSDSLNVDKTIKKGESIGNLPVITRNGYELSGWYTSPEGGEKVLDNTVPTSNVKYYAHWEPISLLDEGSIINEKIKRLSGSNSITSIKRATSSPDTNTMTDDNIVSASTSTSPVYMWYEEGTIYYWSESNIIYANSNSSSLFKGLNEVILIDLNAFDTKYTKNMSEMFAECSNLTTIYVSDRFITNEVEESTNMFNNSTNILGGRGTTYSSSNIDKEYARVDDPDNGNLGYFTYKAAPSSANISNFLNKIKSTGNIIILVGLSISLIIIGTIYLVVKNKKKAVK